MFLLGSGSIKPQNFHSRRVFFTKLLPFAQLRQGMNPLATRRCPLKGAVDSPIVGSFFAPHLNTAPFCLCHHQ